MFLEHNGHRLCQLDEAFQQIVEGRLQQVEDSFFQVKQRQSQLTADVNTAKEEMLKH
jgi:hypothetical protein